MYMSVPQTNIRFIDSLNFLPMALKKLPKTLGLSSSLKKGYFPHMFNNRQHFHQRYFPSYPSTDFYGKDIILQWHNSLQGPYDMHKDYEGST